MHVWFTADLHLGHGNIIKYCKRPFMTPRELEQIQRDPRGKFRLSDESVRRHDEALLAALNERVEEDDTLWILGDFCWGALDQATHYRQRIRCRNVHLVWGNHDHRSIRPVFDRAIEQGMIEVEGQAIWLNHYPMRSWNRSFHGSWQLYGHVHGRLAAEDAVNGLLTRDVGVDACDYRPLTFEDLCAYMAPRVERFHQRKAASRRGDEEPLT
ncbi:MAG: metallophosphoesterase [Gemmataceae bacterium]|nr:metallophosphoesterase [Gemmataceae bacterium]